VIDNQYQQRLSEFISDWETDPDTTIDLCPGFDDFPNDADMLRAHEVEYRARKQREAYEKDYFADVIGMTDPTFDWEPVQEAIWRELGDDSIGEISNSDFTDEDRHRALDWRANSYDGDHLARCARIIGVLKRYPNVEIVKSGRIDNAGSTAAPAYQWFGVIFRAVVTPEMVKRGDTFRFIDFVSNPDRVRNALAACTFERKVSNMEAAGWKTKTVLQSSYHFSNLMGVIVSAVMVRALKTGQDGQP